MAPGFWGLRDHTLGDGLSGVGEGLINQNHDLLFSFILFFFLSDIIKTELPAIVPKSAGRKAGSPTRSKMMNMLINCSIKVKMSFIVLFVMNVNLVFVKSSYYFK